MSQIKELIAELNIPEEKLKELATALNQNPMSAMGLVGQLNIPPQTLQKIMGIVMSNPSAIKDFAKELGVSDDTLSDIENKMGNLQKPQP